MVSEIQAGQTFSPTPTHPPTYLDTMGENNTLTALKGCGVKTGERLTTERQQMDRWTEYFKETLNIDNGIGRPEFLAQQMGEGNEQES